MVSHSLVNDQVIEHLSLIFDNYAPRYFAQISKFLFLKPSFMSKRTKISAKKSKTSVFKLKI